MPEEFGGAAAEALGQLALANGIQCDPLAENRDEIVDKLEAAGVTQPDD